VAAGDRGHAGDAARSRLQSYLDSQLETFVREQVLSLRICDPAAGSGHFLVHVAYTITNFILQVLTSTPWDNPAVNLAADHWRRLVVEKCLYGVDVNGMAVETGQTLLWLASMQPAGRSPSLDHHLKQGNSLLGARLAEITAVLTQSDLNKETRVTRLAEAKGQYTFREMPQVMQKIEQANQLLDQIAGEIVSQAEDIARQEEEYAAAQQFLAAYKEIGNLLVAQKMGLKAKEFELRTIAKALELGQLELLSTQQAKLLDKAGAMFGHERLIHWELEFPEIFFDKVDGAGKKCGFNVVIGNPPFLGGLKISSELGSGFLQYLKTAFIPTSGTADLCAYFFRRTYELIRPGGHMVWSLQIQSHRVILVRQGLRQLSTPMG